MSKLKEKERAISVLRALNHDLISESEKNETKLRDELKQQLENVSLNHSFSAQIDWTILHHFAGFQTEERIGKS